MSKNEIHDKYKWHDLKQNPNDLPKDNSEVLVAIYNTKIDLLVRYRIVWFATDLYECDKQDFYLYKNKRESGFVDYDNDWTMFKVNSVVAWKYIEPFNIADNSK